MLDLVPSTLEAGKAVTKPTSRVVRRVLKDRKHYKYLHSFLKTAITAALSNSRPDVRYAVPASSVDRVVDQALQRAREETCETFWRTLPRQISGKISHRVQDLSLRTSAEMQQVVTRWIKAGLPPGDYDWNDLAERSAAEFREALYEELRKPVIDPSCAAFAIELENAFQKNDRLWRRFFPKRKTDTIKSVSTVAICGLISVIEEAHHNLDHRQIAGAIGFSLITVMWLNIKDHQHSRLDQVVALEVGLDAARDWLTAVKGGELDSEQAHQLLYERVVPRLANWDVPALVALLCRIGDEIEDRAYGRATYDEHQLQELYAEATLLLSKTAELDPPSA